jgi:hypothetical protein
MAFFIVEREAADGGLRLPLSGSFATREEALAALSAAVASRDTTVTGGQFYVLDLEAAVPVLVITAAEMAAPVSESGIADAETTAAEGVSSPAAEEPPSEITPAEVEEPRTEMPLAGVSAASVEGASLADALRRATSSLEESGIRAPESIRAREEDLHAGEDVPGPDHVDAGAAVGVEEQEESEIAAQAYITPELRDIPVAPAVAEPMGSAAVVDEAPPAAIFAGGADEAEAPGSAATSSEWPWANVTAYEPEEGEARDLEVEAASEDLDSLIASAPLVGEEVYLPRPVILGDYGEIPSDEVSAVLEEPGGAGEGASKDEASTPELGYEASGLLDMSAYTCSDCIYSNTCPKVGEVTPAECGTFQWRST